VRSTFRLRLIALALTTLLVQAGPQASADPGLLLIAHGSPRPEWNKPVLDFGARLAEEARKTGRFRAVRTAMLEAVKPDVPSAVAELEVAGGDRILAVPRFVAPSGHTHFDVPAVLGIYRSEKTDAVLAAEGARPARPKVPVVLAPTLLESGVLRAYVLDQVRKLSRSPRDEALVLLAHGDPDHHLLVDRMIRETATCCCGETGINQADWAYIGIGQEYLTQGVGAIRSALEHKKRVLVVGLYVSTCAAKIHQRSVGARPRGTRASDPLLGKDVAFSGEPIIAHPELLRWVLKIAETASSPGPETTAR